MIKKTLPLILLSFYLLAQDEVNLDPSEIPFPAENSNNKELKNEEPAKEPVSIQVPVDELTRKEDLSNVPSVEEKVPSNLQVQQPMTATPENQPNTDLEEKYHRIYEKYNSAETAPENWEKIIGKRKAEIYVVQKGDTLWDISKTLFGDPFFWPKLWAVNKDIIFNPHEIDPKMNIKFYPGAMGIVPSLTFVDKKETSQEQEIPVEEESQKQPEKLTAVEGAKDRTLSLESSAIPNSFPDYVIGNQDKTENITIERRKDLNLRNQVQVEFVVREAPMEVAGTIQEVELGGYSAADLQYVYVKLNNPETKKYTVYRNTKEIKVGADKESSIYLYEVQGEIEILNKVNSQENIYKAMVLKARNFVSKGSIINPGSLPQISSVTGSAVGQASQAKIIGGLQENQLVQKNSFVVMDQGSASGYTKGSYLPIYPNFLARKSATLAVENVEPIGNVIIADSSERYSVGYVKSIFEQIYVQDYVGSSVGSRENQVSEVSESHMQEVTPSEEGTTSEFSESPSVEEDSVTKESSSKGTKSSGTSNETNGL